MPPSVRESLDPSDTMEILGLSRDPHTPCHPLSEYLWTHQTLWRSWDCPGIHIHHATLCQSIFGPIRHYGDPGIVQGSTYTKQPSVRVSMDSFRHSLDTMEILGLSRDPHTLNHPLSEYLWTHQTLWRSWDCPGIHIHQATLCQSICGPIRHYGDPGIVQGSTYTKPPSVIVSSDSFRHYGDPACDCPGIKLWPPYLWTP